MANGYGSSSSSSSASYSPRTTTNISRPPAPPGFHYMPDGSLMSDAEHKKLYGEKIQNRSSRIIRNFKIDTNDIISTGEQRSFLIVGDRDAVFTLFILNNHDKYYNFDTNTFDTAQSSLEGVISSSGVYSGSIEFPALPDTNTDSYTFHLISSIKDNTKHADYVEVRFPDNTIDFNSSSGSSSAVLLKKIYQHADKTLTLTAISPNNPTPFQSVSLTNHQETIQGQKSGLKSSFTIVVTAQALRNFVIKRKITENHFLAYTERTIGSAGVPIDGEDVSASTYYRWPVTNILGLNKGMLAIGNNVTAGSQIGDYIEAVEETIITKSEGLKSVLTSEKSKRDVITNFVPAIKATGTATVTNGVVVSQAGEIVFNKKQADALKDDTIKIYGYGVDSINSLTGYDVKFSNLKVELTAPTATTTAAVTNSTSIPISERAGIRDLVSTVTGNGIKKSSALPVVQSGAGAVNGAGTIVVDTAQTLDNGVTLTFGQAGRVATITGDIEILKPGNEDVTLRVDLEQILTAV